MADSKPAVKSMGILAGITGFIPLVYKLIAIYSSLPPDLISDTQAFATGAFAALIALIGRWKATKPIQGIINQAKDSK